MTIFEWSGTVGERLVSVLMVLCFLGVHLLAFLKFKVFGRVPGIIGVLIFSSALAVVLASFLYIPKVTLTYEQITGVTPFYRFSVPTADIKYIERVETPKSGYDAFHVHLKSTGRVVRIPQVYRESRAAYFKALEKIAAAKGFALKGCDHL